MKREQLAYAVWSWGLQEREQLETALCDIREAGFHNFESVYLTIDLFMDEQAGFKKLVKKYGVQPVSFYFHITRSYDDYVKEIEERLGFMVNNGVSRISVQARGKKGGGATREELAKLSEALNRVGRLLVPYGIIPCLHPHNNTDVMFESDIDFVLRNTDPELVGFGPDTAHLMVGGCDPVSIMARYADRIEFTHLKDVRRNKQSEDVSQAEGWNQTFEVYSDFLELGCGDVDLPGVFAVLDKAGYKGYLTVELDRAPVSNRESVRNNASYMERSLRDIFQRER